MHYFLKLKFHRQINLGLIVWLLAGLSFLNFGSLASAKAVNDTAWQDTGLTVASSTNGFCTDATHPNVLIVNEGTTDQPTGTWAYNWQTGQKTQLNTRPFSICATNGFLYATEANKPALRYSVDDPNGVPLAHTPVAVAQDGSLYTYALDHSSWDASAGGSSALQSDNHLWLSQDGGLTWQERAQNLTGVFYSLIVSPSNARSIYLLTRSLKADQADNFGLNYTLKLYYSADGGATWEMRSQFLSSSYNSPSFLESFTSLNTPVTALISVASGSFHEGPTYDVSLDGGRTFKEMEYVCTYDCSPAYYSSKAYRVSLSFGAKNLLHLKFVGVPNDDSKYGFALEALQADGTLQNIPIPAEIQTLHAPSLQVADNEPNNLFLSAAVSTDDKSQLATWYSPDTGQTWQKLPDTMNYILPTSYAPLTLLGIKNNRLYRLNLASANKSLTQVAPANGGGASQYFTPTGHNLSNLFKSYWESHGGLAQFGYPRTEPLREVNPADGKIYTVQYFERNRFEYHPEFAGTQYEVELGLLGNQLTESRRLAGDGAFNHFDDMHYPGGTYFAATGHNLRNSFKTYWEQHGGLAIYGYPISEEFYEVNPDDGQTYVVQYFERNRFEYHPENKGTQYEVELGLLGNTLLKQKGWL